MNFIKIITKNGEMRFGKAVLVLAVLFFWGALCFGEEESLEEQIRQMKARIEALEKKLSECNEYIKEQGISITKQRQKIEEYENKLLQFSQESQRQVSAPISNEKGLTINAGITTVVQGTDNTNATEKKKENETGASYSADITVEKKFEEIKSEVFLHLETGQGLGLEDELTLYSNVNRDANNDTYIKIAEVWYEQSFCDDKVWLTFGKLDPTVYFDENEVANEETTQFLGRIFRNNPTIEFPDNTAGIKLTLAPLEWLELNYGLFDANSDWEKIGDNLFNIGQVTFKPRFFERDGNYRLFTWYNNLYHTKWLDATNTKEGAYGFGLSVDQKISDSLTVFTRYGWQNPKVYNPNITTTGGGLNYSLEHSLSGGVQLEGRPWGRERDILAFAIGEAIPSGDYKKADASRRAKNEGHFETYYNIHVNDHLSISPDFQYIWNPFGKDVTDDTDTIFVYGLRTQVDF
ncbi:MAG: carbohydrate porin [Candidatus Omnitrophica bacterium]|nr:carbohydrate porin [Candidatus Omnitrophota bacterium]